MRKKKLVTLLYAISFIAAVYFLILNPLIIEPYLLRTYHKYTIGVVKKKFYPANGDPDAEIYYNVNGVTYNASVGVGNFDHKVDIGNWYYVKYYTKKPKLCDVIADVQVLDTAIYIPPDGWEKISFDD